MCGRCVIANSFRYNFHTAHFLLQNFIPTVDGKFSPSPAPNLSRTPGTVSDTHHPKPNEHTVEILQEVGLSSEEITRLAINKTIRLSKSDSKL